MIAGDIPESELFRLNQKYDYGFCYEACREKQQFDALCAYIQKAYEQKTTSGKIGYNPMEELFFAFRYDHIAGELERLCLSLVQNE